MPTADFVNVEKMHASTNLKTMLGEKASPRIVVFRALVLGDMLCSVPALRALRGWLPRAQITLAGLPWARQFVQRFDRYLDDFLEFPGYPGLPEMEPQLDKIPLFFLEAQRRKFDLAIQLHGSGSYVNSITALLGARLNAGFYLPGEFCPDERFFLSYPKAETEVGTMLRLMEFLGAPLQGDALEFPVTASDYEMLAAIKEVGPVMEGAYVCLHPGARFPSRRWPAERFAAVGDALAREGLHIVITGSPDEIPLTAQVSQAMRAPHVNLGGRTSIGMMAALYSRARLLVSNDTGVSHLVAALRLPSVVIVSGSDPARWSPANRSLHRTVFHPIDCRPCMHLTCPIGHPCALSVTTAEVVSEARSLLQS